MISVAEAREIILKETPLIGEELVGLREALGRVLAEEVVARRSMPPYDNSAMDGYAVQFADIESAAAERPIKLKVLEDLPAGKIAIAAITPGTAIRIMTGAPLPQGADTVIMVENTRRLDGAVEILAPAKRGANIRRAGEDIKTGAVILPAHTVLSPAHLGILAMMGRFSLRVYRRPTVAILATGDELVNIDEEPGPGKIVNSNSYTLAAQVEEAGGVPWVLPIARDRKEEIAHALTQAFRAEVVISSGGVSVGDYDFVKAVISEFGFKILFWKVAIKPGKPTVFGRNQAALFFGLPGNPVSSMVTFEQLVRPSLLKMMGRQHIYRPTLWARLGEDVKKKPGQEHYIRCFLKQDSEGYIASLTGEQGSGILSSMALADGLMVVPRDHADLKAGEKVQVQLLNPNGRFLVVA